MGLELAKCQQCGAQLQYDKQRKLFFCAHCGAVYVGDNSNEDSQAPTTNANCRVNINIVNNSGIPLSIENTTEPQSELADGETPGFFKKLFRCLTIVLIAIVLGVILAVICSYN